VNGVSRIDTVFTMFHAHFLWLSNGLGLPDPLYILPVLAGITQWVQSRMMLTRATDQQQQTMNFMMNFMPLMIVFFATRYASGLSLYWVTSTLIGILVQYRITGLGLLTEQWPLSLIGASSSGPSVRHSSALVSGIGKKSANGNGSKLAPLSALPNTNGDTPAVEGNDSAGSGDNSTNGNTKTNGNGGSAAARPRKKANRAKGGRNAGRRG
jgi:YidC/Oxa1 family membrane protein insertase